MNYCDTCKFWDAEEPATDNEFDTRYGECRRYPPAITEPRTPTTPDYYWCGEWSKKDAVA